MKNKKDKYLGIEFYDTFYTIIKGKVKEWKVASGISLRRAVEIKKTGNYYDTWSEANDKLKKGIISWQK